MENYSALSLFNEVAILLKNDFPPEEIHSLQRIIFEKKLGLLPQNIYLNPNTPINPKDADIIIEIVSLLKLQKPIQYILGEADFFGLKFRVTPDVLIPRQETEELVDWIIKSTGNLPCTILDIGTGSGCIAISLAANLPNSKVSALDISLSALEVAKWNANTNKVSIAFNAVDFLDSNSVIPNKPFDIIVSNPPYVREMEKEQMKANVLDHEPHIALFVSNDDPLIFYRTIAERSKELLKPAGSVFCEINEALGYEVTKLFIRNGFKEVEIRKDLNGKDRMLKAILK